MAISSSLMSTRASSGPGLASIGDGAAAARMGSRQLMSAGLKGFMLRWFRSDGVSVLYVETECLGTKVIVMTMGLMINYVNGHHNRIWSIIWIYTSSLLP